MPPVTGDRDVPRPPADPHRVAEVERRGRGGRPAPGRGTPARPRTARGCGRGAVLRRAVRRPTLPASRRAARPAARTRLPSGTSRSPATSGQEGPPLARVLDRADRAEEPGVVDRQLRGARSGGSCRRGRARPPRAGATAKRPAGDDRQVRRRQAHRAPGSRRRAGPAPPEPRRAGGGHRRRCASDQGAARRSRSRSPIRCRSRLPVVQARTWSTSASSGSGGTSAPRAVVTHRDRVGSSPAAPGSRHDAGATVVADLQDLDPAVEEVGQRCRRRPEARGARRANRRAGPRGRTGGLVGAAGGGRRPARRRSGAGSPGGSGAEALDPGPAGRIAPPRIDPQLGAPAGDRGDEGGQVVERGPLVGAGRIAGREEDGRDVGAQGELGHLARVVRLGRGALDPPGGPRRDPLERCATDRRDAPITTRVRARTLRLSSRGRPSRSAVAGRSPRRGPDRRPATPGRQHGQDLGVVDARPAPASEPTRRQRSPGRPSRATAVVAAPASTATSALGALVTTSCYRPGAGDDAGTVRRPRRSPRRAPRGAR